MNEEISPELVLVSPELRARAIAALPPIDADSFLPRPAKPVASQGHAVIGGLLDLIELGAVACIVVVGVVLVLTVVADAVR